MTDGAESEMANRVALVTGASRGVGRGVATELANRGYRVYGTGRTIQEADLPDEVIRLTCDHTDDRATEGVFHRIRDDGGHLDILVNSAWGGYERMVEGGEFTWPAPFWEQPRWRWSAMMDAGVRALFVASQEAARLMVPRKQGLIVNLSYWAGQTYMGNAIYGVSKAATDRLTRDMARELRKHDVAVVSLYPGLVRTEAVLESGAFDLSDSESPEFIGRAVAALADGPGLMKRSGRVVVAATLARELGFTDVDGSTPPALTLDDVRQEGE